MTEKHDLMSLNQQIDARALIDEIERLANHPELMYGERCEFILADVRRYKEKWP